MVAAVVAVATSCCSHNLCTTIKKVANLPLRLLLSLGQIRPGIYLALAAVVAVVAVVVVVVASVVPLLFLVLLLLSFIDILLYACYILLLLHLHRLVFKVSQKSLAKNLRIQGHETLGLQHQ